MMCARGALDGTAVKRNRLHPCQPALWTLHCHHDDNNSKVCIDREIMQKELPSFYPLLLTDSVHHKWYEDNAMNECLWPFNVCLCVCLCMHVHTCKCTCIKILHVYMCGCVCVCVCDHTGKYACVIVKTGMHPGVLPVYLQSRVWLWANVRQRCSTALHWSVMVLICHSLSGPTDTVRSSCIHYLGPASV